MSKIMIRIAGIVLASTLFVMPSALADEEPNGSDGIPEDPDEPIGPLGYPYCSPIHIDDDEWPPVETRDYCLLPPPTPPL
jgi:hypothetical protein